MRKVKLLIGILVMAVAGLVGCSNGNSLYNYINQATGGIATLDAFGITYIDTVTNKAIYGLKPDCYNMTDGVKALPVYEKTGYYFNGWYAKSDFSGTAETSIAPESAVDKIFYAKLTPKYVRIMYNNNGGTGSTTLDYVYFDSNYTLKSDTCFTAPAGKRFAGWSTHASGAAEFTGSQKIISKFEENSVLYAVWVDKDSLVITYNDYDSTTDKIVDDKELPSSFTKDKVVKIPALLNREDGEFIGWFDSNNNLVTELPGSYIDDIILTAKWEPIYTITYFDYDAATDKINGSDALPVKFTKNNTITVPSLMDRESSLFVKWTDQYSNVVTTFTPNTYTENLYLTANWNPIYKIIYAGMDEKDAADGDKVLPVKYTSDVETTIPVLKNRTDAIFTGWHINGNPVTKIAAGTTGDVTVTATWTPIYTITYSGFTNTDEVEGGVVLPAQYSVLATVKLPNLKNRSTEGFEGWYTAGDIKIENTSGKSENLVLTAKWNIHIHSVKFNGMNDGDSVVGGGSLPSNYNDQNNVTLPALNDREGYVFDGWYDSVNNKVTGWSAGEKTDDLTLTAKFTKFVGTKITSDSVAAGNTVVINPTLFKSRPYVITVLDPDFEITAISTSAEHNYIEDGKKVSVIYFGNRTFTDKYDCGITLKNNSGEDKACNYSVGFSAYNDTPMTVTATAASTNENDFVKTTIESGKVYCYEYYLEAGNYTLQWSDSESHLLSGYDTVDACGFVFDYSNMDNSTGGVIYNGSNSYFDGSSTNNYTIPADGTYFVIIKTYYSGETGKVAHRLYKK